MDRVGIDLEFTLWTGLHLLGIYPDDSLALTGIYPVDGWLWLKIYPVDRIALTGHMLVYFGSLHSKKNMDPCKTVPWLIRI